MKNFYIYKSSAGSGKTDTLVIEYLKIALKHPDNFKKILAVTFTNKAAAEMKNRIITVLEKLALSELKNIEHIRHSLVKELQISDISTLAKITLSNILHNYSYFSISTIDSFFNKILRAFSRELNLQLGFEIEMDYNYVLEELIDKLLDDAGKEPDITEYLENFIIYSMEQDEGWNIEYKIKSIAEEIFKERFNVKTKYGKGYEDKDKNLEEFIKELFQIRNYFETSLRTIGESTNLLFKKYNVTYDNFYYKRGGFAGYLSDNLLNGKYEPTSRSRTAADKTFIYSKHKDELSKTVLDNGLYELLIKAIEFYDKNNKSYNTANQILKTIYVIGIFSELLKRLKKYRDENNVILISDINNLLFNIITGQFTPFLYEKTGNQYNYFLIDEFQDTSLFQWKNFKPLIENSISENNYSLIVGDVKQAIYRWRNGNMMLLLEDAEKDLAHFRERIEVKVLNENFRSRIEITDFNNSFFTSAADYCQRNAENKYSEYISKAYSDIKQENGRKITGGFVKVRLIENKSVDSDESNDLLNSNDIALQELLNDINKVINLNYKKSDIMILVRKNTEAKIIAEHLISNGIDIISNESLLLLNSSYVKLLIAFYRYIVNPNDIISKAEILFNYIALINKDEFPIVELFLNLDKYFHKLMPEEIFESPESDMISNSISGLHLYEITETLIRKLKLDNLSDIYLTEFLNYVNNFSQKKHAGIIQFLKWWDDNSADLTISVPEGINAVKILTIHKAKGLQAPVVMIPFANWKFDLDGKKDIFWTSTDEQPFNQYPAYLIKATKNLENTHFSDDYNFENTMTIIDNLNLLYVAFTRAEEKLFVYAPAKKNNEFNAATVIKNSIEENKYLSNYYDEDNSLLIIGSIDNIKNVITEDIKNIIKEKIITSDIYEKISLENIYDKHYNDNLKNNARNTGIIIHKILSDINNPSDYEIKYTLDKFYRLGIIKKDQVEELIDTLKKIFSNDTIKSWFDSNLLVLNEQEILLPDGNIYRPDKIIIEGNNVTIIDFKTGSVSESDTEQIKNYANIVEQMGYTVKNMYLVYLHNLEIIDVK